MARFYVWFRLFFAFVVQQRRCCRKPARRQHFVRVLHPHLQSRRNHMGPYCFPQVRSVLVVLMGLLYLHLVILPTLWMKLLPVHHSTIEILLSQPARGLIRITAVCPRSGTYVVPLTFGLFAAPYLRGASPAEFIRLSGRETTLAYQLIYYSNYSFIPASSDEMSSMILSAGDTDYGFAILISKCGT